ncbi:MAG: radical SAM protein [Firmicutes bacterium HGW-Firmicutes-15]|nr:MAG: radical SAM protein [Firmicutes bacterium HGW-Firmicutes-15]
MNCNYCEWRCDLSKGNGICGRYIVSNGIIAEKEPMSWISYYFYRIEEMPFFHALPGAIVMQIGTKGCNASCDYCVNAHIAIKEEPGQTLKPITGKHLVQLAIDGGAGAVVFAINEVTVFLPSAIEAARAAHEAGLKVGCLTNGYLTEESANMLGNEMDFINISLKSISDEFYQKNLGLPSVKPILRNIKALSKLAHIEVLTPIVHEITHDEVLKIAYFIADVDENIPWHLFRLQPTYKRVDENPLDIGAMIKIVEQAKKILPFIYFGNFAGSQWVNTRCPGCGHVLVKRVCIGSCGSKFGSIDMDGNRCPKCGKNIPVIR